MKVRVSIRTDLDKTFRFPQVIDIKSIDADEDIIETHYRLPSPIHGDWFALKVEFLDRTVLDVRRRKVALRRIGFELQPTHPTATKQTRSDSVNKATE